MNPDRGVNELTKSQWENGVLTWTCICPRVLRCIVSYTVCIGRRAWDWADGGNGGTTYFVRQP